MSNVAIVKETLKEHSGIIKQFVEVGYSQEESNYMFELYFSKLEKYMTPEQLSVYSDIISTLEYKKFVETNAHFAASTAYEEFLHDALMQEAKQQGEEIYDA